MADFDDLEIEINAEPEFKILYNLPPEIHTVICVGGRGGKKTYEISKRIAYAATIETKRCVILRDEQVRIKESILNEIWSRYKTANEDGLLDYNFIKNETELKERETGETLIYTRGFRASTTSKQSNLKGDSDIDIAVIEEAEDIRDVSKYNTFVDSLRKDGCVVIILLNTPDLQHWLIKRWFNAIPILDKKGEATGYFIIEKKESVTDLLVIQTSYKDNPYLPAYKVAEYEGYGTPSHHLFDLHHYFTAILGYASTGRKGQIFTKFKPISLEKYRALRLTEFYGQDFGTASPAALIGVKFEGNTAYVRLLNYKPMDVLEIGKLYCSLKMTKSDRIICDYAGSEQIKKLKGGFKNLAAHEYELYPTLANGFFTVNCPTKDIQGDISLIKSMEVFCVEEDIDLWEEVNNYCYAQDKFGNYVDDPIDDFNHALDALRYVIADQRGKQKMFGV